MNSLHNWRDEIQTFRTFHEWKTLGMGKIWFFTMYDRHIFDRGKSVLHGIWQSQRQNLVHYQKNFKSFYIKFSLTLRLLRWLLSYEMLVFTLFIGHFGVFHRDLRREKSFSKKNLKFLKKIIKKCWQSFLDVVSLSCIQREADAER